MDNYYSSIMYGGGRWCVRVCGHLLRGGVNAKWNVKSPRNGGVTMQDHVWGCGLALLLSVGAFQELELRASAGCLYGVGRDRNSPDPWGAGIRVDTAPRSSACLQLLHVPSEQPGSSACGVSCFRRVYPVDITSVPVYVCLRCALPRFKCEFWIVTFSEASLSASSYFLGALQSSL